jgi:hypothetical protein
LIVLDITALPDELEELLDPADAAGLLELELEVELAQAATASTTVASPAALHSLRITHVSLSSR